MIGKLLGRLWSSITTARAVVGDGKFVAKKCGHTTDASGPVSAFGVTITTEMPVEDGEVDWCLGCLSAMAISCAWCGHPIFIGNPVTLNVARDPKFAVIEHAVVYSEHPFRLVGCLRWDCAETGADRAGFWLPGDDGIGIVHRVMSPLEQAMTTGNGVVVQDLSSLKEATRAETNQHLQEEA
jgi:hypothetical protein